MPDEAPLRHALPPVVDARTRVLILGSLPGERSIAAQRYYAHPGNAFWWLMGQVLGAPDLPARAYPERLALLGAHGVGLWDVVGSARRRGSLDAAIRDPAPRDLRAFAEDLPALRAIAFNGGTAARLGRRQLGNAHWDLLDLPSSSAAHASLTRADKLAQWRQIGGWSGMVA